MTWLDGWERIEATTAGGSYIGAPWKLCLHTTEGSSIAGAVAAYKFHGGWPHVTVDPQTRERAQHYPLTTSSRALAHPKGTPETNRANAINVEIVGQAAHIGDLTGDELAWLGAEVVAPLCEAVGIPLSTSVEWVPYPSSYGLGASQRLTWADWADYSGVLAHEHVPGNDHGDTGALDIAAVLTAASPPQPVEDDMPPAPDSCVDSVGRLWVVARGDDRAIWAKVGESVWFTLDGVSLSGPTIAAFPDGSMAVSAVGEDNAVWRKDMAADGVWSGWYSIGGRVA